MRDPLLKDQVFKESRLSSDLPSRSTISTSESGQELWPVGVKLGIVRLGHAAGKLKYTLVDEQDIVLAREYTFEARVEVDIAVGAVVFAYAFLTSKSRSGAILLQDLVWRRHNGPIPDKMRVVHRNHIAMDNRLDNLCLIDISNGLVWYATMNTILSPLSSLFHRQTTRRMGQPEQAPRQRLELNASHNVDIHKSTPNDLQLTLYWAAIQQLPPEQQSEPGNVSGSANCITNRIGERSSTGEENDRVSSTYYECHYAPCVRIEREPREFSICGRCHETRYCGTACQQLDWPQHRRQCRMKSRRSAAPYYRRHDNGSYSSGSE